MTYIDIDPITQLDALIPNWQAARNAQLALFFLAIRRLHMRALLQLWYN
jgi:hypothetical protein